MDDPGPSDRDRIDAIHRHAHQALRYYATAFLHERGDDRDLMRVSLDLTGNFMALIEGASLDEASMMERRSEIVERYLEERPSAIRGRHLAASAARVRRLPGSKAPASRPSWTPPRRSGPRRHGSRARPACRSFRQRIATNSSGEGSNGGAVATVGSAQSR
jgi:hypothetical protein